MSHNIDEEFIVYGESNEHYNIDKRGIGAFVFDAFNKHSNKLFQVLADGSQRETYASFKKRCIRMAISLKKLGVTCNDIISVCSANSLDNYLPIMASLFLGAKVSSLEPELSLDEQKYLLNIVKPKIIFVQKQSYKLIAESLDELNTAIIIIGDVFYENMLKEQDSEESFAPTIVDGQETAFIFFSSGSTSLPKGICMSNYAILHNVENHLSKEPYNHQAFVSPDSSYWTLEITLILMIIKTGAHRVILTETVDGNFDYLMKTIHHNRVTFALLSSTMTNCFLSLYLDKYDLTNFHTMAVTGSKLSCEHLKKLRLKFPLTNIVYCYGQTETQHVLQFNMAKDRELYLRKPDSVGKLCNGIAAKIVDLHTNVAVGPNKEGELRIKSPSIMTGYYNNNESSFDDCGFYLTGDIAYYDNDECFYIVNRIKDMFKFQDWVIVPFFIEQCLMKHPAVEEAVVFGIPDVNDGELISALVTIKNGCSTSEDILQKFVSKRLTAKHKVRGGIKFVDEIPKTATHKIMRHKARQIFMNTITNGKHN